MFTYPIMAKNMNRTKLEPSAVDLSGDVRYFIIIVIVLPKSMKWIINNILPLKNVHAHNHNSTPFGRMDKVWQWAQNTPQSRHQLLPNTRMLRTPNFAHVDGTGRMGTTLEFEILSTRLKRPIQTWVERSAGLERWKRGACEC